MTFYYRKDIDGKNPIDDISNEIYHSGQFIVHDVIHKASLASLNYEYHDTALSDVHFILRSL